MDKWKQITKEEVKALVENNQTWFSYQDEYDYKKEKRHLDIAIFDNTKTHGTYGVSKQILYESGNIGNRWTDYKTQKSLIRSLVRIIDKGNTLFILDEDAE